MEIGERRAREEGAARGAVLPDLVRPGHAEVPAVILINLLPHREAARKRRREAFYATLGASALAGRPDRRRRLPLVRRPRSPASRRKNSFLQAEIKKLEAEIKDIATLQAEIAALRARQQAVEDLQGDRNMPVHLLNELVRQLPDGVYLTSMKQDNQTVTLQGMAQSNERVSELLRNLGNNSPWLAKPELVEITAGTVDAEPARPAARGQLHDARRPASGRPTRRRPAAPRRAAPASAPAAAARSEGAKAPIMATQRASQQRSTSPPPLQPLRRPVPRAQSERPVRLAAGAALGPVPGWSRRRSWWRCGSSGSPTRTTSSRPSAPRKSTLRADYKKKLAQAVNLDAAARSSASRCSST